MAAREAVYKRAEAAERRHVERGQAAVRPANPRRKDKPPFVRAAGKAKSEWRMYDNGELNVKEWPEARMRATKGKGFYTPLSAPVPTEPQYSDPTVKVPGQEDYRKEAELISIWRAQEGHKHAQVAAQEQQEAAADLRHLRQQAAWAESERSAEAFKRQSQMMSMRRGLDAQIKAKKHARAIAAAEEAAYARGASLPGTLDAPTNVPQMTVEVFTTRKPRVLKTAWTAASGSPSVPVESFVQVHVARAAYGGPAAVSGGGGYAAGVAAVGTSPAIECVVLSLKGSEPQAGETDGDVTFAGSPDERLRISRSEPRCTRGTNEHSKHGGHGGDYRRGRGVANHDHRPIGVAWSNHSLNEQREKFGWGGGTTTDDRCEPKGAGVRARAHALDARTRQDGTQLNEGEDKFNARARLQWKVSRLAKVDPEVRERTRREAEVRKTARDQAAAAAETDALFAMLAGRG